MADTSLNSDTEGMSPKNISICSISLSSNSNVTSPTIELCNNGSLQQPYELNPTKSLQKLLNATSRENLTISETRGGFRLYFATGHYAEFRRCLESFYSTSKKLTTDLTKKVDVNAKCESSIIRVNSTDKNTSCRYAINLFHTTASALVNGIDQNVFISDHLPAVLEQINI
ncbi:hypothetical protein SNE40_021166 [Patella caerulea]|uniref:Uncharacterized protein n=1 Tax=Patella caerulea TaxID=87958 RepID=A0AAN8J0G5_PATCE